MNIRLAPVAFALVLSLLPASASAQTVQNPASQQYLSSVYAVALANQSLQPVVINAWETFVTGGDIPDGGILDDLEAQERPLYDQAAQLGVAGTTVIDQIPNASSTQAGIEAQQIRYGLNTSHKLQASLAAQLHAIDLLRAGASEPGVFDVVRNSAPIDLAPIQAALGV
jgi:hypothetical protein